MAIQDIKEDSTLSEIVWYSLPPEIKDKLMVEHGIDCSSDLAMSMVLEGQNTT